MAIADAALRWPSSQFSTWSTSRASAGWGVGSASSAKATNRQKPPVHLRPPGEIFEPIPRDDYVTALVHGIDELIEEIETDTFNVVLTLARIWCGIVTGEVRSKDAAADWVLQRLPSEHRAALAEARALYLGDQEEESVHFKHLAAAYAEHITATIRGLPDARAVDARSSRP
jgi:hypothetical protein